MSIIKAASNRLARHIQLLMALPIHSPGKFTLKQKLATLQETKMQETNARNQARNQD